MDNEQIENNKNKLDELTSEAQSLPKEQIVRQDDEQAPQSSSHPAEVKAVHQIEEELSSIGQVDQGEVVKKHERGRNLNAEFYIFRHGITEHGGEEGKYGARVFLEPISEEGLKATERMAKEMKEVSEREGFQFDALYVSPSRRCRETAAIVSDEIGVKPTVDARLMGKASIEPKLITKKRLKSFLARVEKEGHKHVAICTHERIMSGLMSLLEERKKFSVSDRYKTGEATILGTDGEVRTIDANAKAK